MKKTIVKKAAAGALAGVLLMASPLLGAPEKFRARLLSQGGPVSTRAMNFEILVESYTGIEEVSLLAKTLSESGYDPFMNAFIAMNKGSFRPIGGRGLKIAIHAAHSIPTAKGRQILLFTQRQHWDPETTQSVDRRFPFMVIELNLNKKGNGEGKIYEQANVRLSSEAGVEMEAYNSVPLMLWGVRTVK
ncbi:MAG: hypothetical protein AB1715_08500 [Acidobacteriota bacterium]